MSLKKSIYCRPEGSATQGHVDLGGAETILTLCWLAPQTPTNGVQRDAASCKAVNWPRLHSQGGVELGMNMGLWG